MIKRLISFVVLLVLVVPSAGAHASAGYNGYTPVAGREELIELISENADKLVPEVFVRITDYSEDAYAVDWCELFPFKEVKMHGIKRNEISEYTIEITYTQAERVLFSLKGGRINLTRREQLVAAEAKNVFDEIIDEGMTDYEKQLAVHDYLVRTAAYDDSRVTPIDSYEAYGVFVNKTAVCQGYTEAARILLSLAGIENGTLSGTADGQSHIWNIVQQDGDYYHMDITWDAALELEDGSRALSHAYFNLTDDEISESHIWDEAVRDEKFDEDCFSDEYNYFKLNGIEVNSNNEYIELVKENYKAGKREFEVLFDGLSVNDADSTGAALAAGSHGYAGFTNEDRNVLWIRFK